MRRAILMLLALAGGASASGCLHIGGELGSVSLPVSDSTLSSIEARTPSDFAPDTPPSIENEIALFDKRALAEGETPESLDLALDQLRALVLSSNLDLAVQRLEPQRAQVRVSRAEARFDALVRVKGAFGDKDTPRLDGPLVDFDSLNPALDEESVKLTELEAEKESLDFGLGVEVPLPTGGSIKLDTMFDGDRTSDPRRFEQFVSATRFSFSQPLLRGAGTDASFAPIRLARVEARRVEARTQLMALGLLARAEKAYWSLYASRRVLDVRSEQLRLAAENLALVQRRVEEGLSAEVEIIRSRLGVAQRRESLIVAETAWRVRQRALKAIVNRDDLPLRGAPMIDTTTEPRLVGFECDPDTLVAEALENRIELIELELRLVQDNIEVDFRRDQVLPLVNLDFQYGLLDRNDGFDRAWTDQWRFDHHEFKVGLEVELPVANQRRRAELAESLLRRTQRYATREARRMAVRQEVLNAVDTLSQNWQRVLAARQNVIVAGVNYDAEQRQFQEGFRTMREVLEALSDLGDAQLGEVRAIVDYQVAQIDLAFATGTLFGYSRVDLDLPDSSDAALEAALRDE